MLCSEIQHLVPRNLQKLRSLVVARPPRWQKSNATNAQGNIAHHYDLSNDLFELFLDPTLSYSSALFHDPATATRADLEPAQGRKIERLLDQAGVGEGSRVLEIGSGWGELAIRAARRGATVRTITLSVEQKVLAEERIAAAGCADLVTVDLCDYRDVTGTYDAVVSVEMIEAVGWQYWQTYFETIDQVLAPGGRAAIQAITMPDDRMRATKRTYTWINKYIFPGGFLPSVEVTDDLTCAHTSLRLADRHSMGPHYAATLRLWDQAFLSHSEQVLSLGFDETFLRMWHFYLEYSRAGFASGYIDVNQLTFTKSGVRRRDRAAVLAAGLVAAAVVMVVTALWPAGEGRVKVVDVAWGLGFVLVAMVAGLIGSSADDGDPTRRWLLVLLVGAWGLRLALHIGRHPRGNGEDPRYEKLLGGTVDQVGMARAVRKVFAIQGSAIWLVSLPVMVGAVLSVEWWPVVIAGSALWLVGLVFEAVGDAQLAAYKEIPKDQRPPVHGQRPVALHPTPQLLRRCRCHLGAVAGRRARLRLGRRPRHGRGAGRDDLLPGLRHRRPAARADDDAAPRLSGVRRPHLDVHPPAAAALTAAGEDVPVTDAAEQSVRRGARPARLGRQLPRRDRPRLRQRRRHAGCGRASSSAPTSSG